MERIKPNFSIKYQDGKYLLRFNHRKKDIHVKILFLRPLSGSHSEISFYDIKNKTEIASTNDIKSLDTPSQKIIKQALQERYFMPEITSISNLFMDFGVRYFTANTNKGTIIFTLINPARNIAIYKNKITFKDTLGNFYLLKNPEKMDSKTIKFLNMVI